MEKKTKIEDIPNATLKLLSDKSLDKKKEGMQKLEEFLSVQIENLEPPEVISLILKFRVLCDSTQQINTRKAGFLCYKSLVSVINRKSEEKDYTIVLDQIISDILLYLKDNDQRIIISCAECLFHIINNFKIYVLTRFQSFLDGLLALVTIQNSEVKAVASSLDSLLKSVINFSIQGDLPKDFNLLNFFEIIIKKLSLKNLAIKCTIVSWIIFINNIPEIKLINILDTFLPDLLSMLSSRSSEVVKTAADCLKDLYNEIDNGFNTLKYDREVKILEILEDFCKKTNHTETKKTTFNWIILFLKKYSSLLIQSAKTSSVKKENLYKSAIIKPSSSMTNQNGGNNFLTPKEQLFEMESSKIEEMSLSNNNINMSSSDTERKYPFDLFSMILELVLVNVTNQEIIDKAMEANKSLLKIVDYIENNKTVKLFEEVLLKYFDRKEPAILVLVFEWVAKLFTKFHEDTFTSFETFMQRFTMIIENSNDEIFLKALEIICTIAKYKEEYTEIIIYNIVDKLKNEKNLLKFRGNKILSELSKALQVDKVYSTFANVLVNIEEIDFVEKMINILNLFLLTSKETKSLRNLLKNVKKNNSKFFIKLFRTWCINPISTLILCLIAEYFELSYSLIEKMKEFELSEQNYLELAQLVQLLESKVFLHLRIYLLEPKKYRFLVKTLFGISCMLTRGKAYQVLFKRLDHVGVMIKFDVSKVEEKNEEKEKQIKEYMDIFDKINKKKNNSNIN